MEKKKPLRMCVACRQMKEKSELVRIVKSGDKVSVDFTGKASGRGAYVCKDGECVNKLSKYKLLNKAFSADVTATDYASITESIKNA